MRANKKPFFALTADDLMSEDVVAVSQEMSLPAAARLLSGAHITGAPVVDAEGVCVGVLSATDYLGLAEAGSRASPSPACVCSDWQMSDIKDSSIGEVRRHMTADPVTASPEASIRELARLMTDAHVHRVIVVNASSRPVGVVSSTDIIAAVAYAS